MAAKQPPWEQPKKLPGVELPPLRIYNSLTKTKNDFVPLDPEGKVVTWYCCGPTTYDISHLGKKASLIDVDRGVNCWKGTAATMCRYETILRSGP
jgi:cysteinyl-tRNA synthetase